MIAWLDPQTRSVEVIPVSDGKTLFPSLIHLSPDGTIVAGEAAQPALTLHPDEVIFSVKRLIGISSTEFEQLRPHYAYLKNARFGVNGVEIPGPDGKWFSAIDLSAQILSSIVAEAAAIKNVSVARAVITVPAYFDESQRTSTKRAGELAGLEVLRIINEPTAACLAYGYGDSTNAARSVVVYDLGGGTFDVSIVRVESGVFEVLSTNGNTQLGGDDIDRSIVSYWRHQHSMLLPDDRDSLRTMAKMAKESLSENDQFSSVYKDITLHLTKQTLGELSAPWIDKTIQSCQFALNDAGMKISEVDDVILVGGSTRMPYIKARVADFFQKPVNDRINPDEVVAVGAAIQAAQLSGTEMGHLLLDVTPLSLGIETAGGLMDVLIPRNSKIPMGVSRQYTTQRDGQSSIRISIYQGERDLITYNRELASFQVTGIPAMPAGLPKLNVSFHIDADGLLRVTAQEMRSGVRQEVVVNPAANLTKDQIDQRLEEAFLHADEDKEARTRISLQEEAQSMITNLQKIIRTNQEWIDPSVSQDLINRCQQLEEASHKGTIAEIRSILEELEKVARPVAEEVMNKAVGNRLRDTSI